MKWALLGLFAALPLQWYVVPGMPLGPQRLHLLAIAVFTGVVLVRHQARAMAPVAKVVLPVLIALGVFVVTWFATNLYHSAPFRAPLQEAIQMLALVAVGTVVYRAATYPATRVLEALRWTSLVAISSTVIALALSMQANGVDPVATFGQTIAQGDPEILQKGLFKSAFAGYGFDSDAVQGNIRHEVFGAVLIAMLLSSAAVRLRPFANAGARLLYRAALAVGILLLVVSLSRSVILAAVTWALLSLSTPLRRFGLTPRQLAAGAAAAVIALVVVASGFASVLWVRFTQDTSSYEVRDTLLSAALQAIPEHLWTGGVEVAGASSHNFVIDSTLRAGLLGGIAALGVTILLIVQFAYLVLRLPSEPAWMLPVTAAMALPIIRLFTAGGGVIPPVQYVGLGIVAGFLAYRMSAARRGAAADPVLEAALMPGSRAGATGATRHQPA